MAILATFLLRNQSRNPTAYRDNITIIMPTIFFVDISSSKMTKLTIAVIAGIRFMYNDATSTPIFSIP